MKGKTALIAGSSGLVGNELLNLLLEGKEYEQIYAIVRKSLNLYHPKLTEVVVDFERLEDYKDYFAVTDVFSCLGTTIKKAKTQEAMDKVDLEYSLTIAKLANEKGAKQFTIISSMHADPNSPNSYLNMKGRLEQELIKIPFETISILQPSLLLGERQEFRFGEKLGRFFMRLISVFLVGPLKKYKAIKGETVALAMYWIAQTEKKGLTVYQSEEIELIGNNIYIEEI